MIPATYLFVPGNRPERFAKALASAADRVIVDLEDAVAPADKASARNALGAWLPQLSATEHSRVMVRINDALSPWHADDLAWLSVHAVDEVMLSKCESAVQIATVHARIAPSARVLPLIETVRGVMGLNEIALAPHVSRLAFGSIDYLLDLDLPGPGFALDAAATAIAMASRAAELPAPVAGVTPELDAERVTADLLHARGLGFGAKLCIHPTQVGVVREAMRPDAQTLAWASRVHSAWQAANSQGAIQVDGRMVDKPVALRAQRILALAGLPI
ncbi:citrate lyase subunit beta/citryl-CoA lyase [Hydrogenophaga palleronii]|uniref:Citrate lyase subunit beta/citryl-CoA lyase n=1 Tax=Hydrogenophaga palleronii TaxID=65655 RepID=A0ABU1WU98_9BURK|nr:CoA ester lyase [Hydrogenophaga palleronii]MDR7152506.1 citrate lyase subunit beta/citryl-CoA lyase [Hydrogenophaga palleronii]